MRHPSAVPSCLTNARVCLSCSTRKPCNFQKILIDYFKLRQQPRRSYPRTALKEWVISVKKGFCYGDKQQSFVLAWNAMPFNGILMFLPRRYLLWDLFSPTCLCFGAAYVWKLETTKEKSKHKVEKCFCLNETNLILELFNFLLAVRSER